MSEQVKPFKLRKVLQTNQYDVRSVAKYSEDGFVCGSRDKISKLYVSEKNGNGFIEAQNFTGPTHYVSSVAVMTVNNEHIIYVGSNDACIYCYDLKSAQPNCILVGHSGTVCSLYGDSANQLLMSGSWDQTAQIWRGNAVDKVLKGHSGSVWAVCSTEDIFLTGSADKLIKRWDKNGKDVKTYEGHTDCVRGLAIINKDNFLSCSNDGTIRHWNTLTGSVIQVFNGHENYIYDISLLKSDLSSLEFVTCSEDRTIRFWKADGENTQTIRLPAPTAWSVAAIDESDVAVGCSDGRVYTFTRVDSRVASEEEIKLFEDEVAKSTLPIKELGDIKADQLPGQEALHQPGKKEGATKLIREGDKIVVYQWSSMKMEWSKVGDVVGEANTDKDPSAKTEFEGKEYDFVFNVDIKDGEPALKLPFNMGDDPWMAAQQFIWRHDLSQLYLDQIAQFIIKNTGGAAPAPRQTSTEYVDPWTGGSRYVPP